MLDSEIMFYKAATINDLDSNGGRLGITYYTTGAIAEVFDHVLKSERDSGSIKYRKVSVKDTNDDQEQLVTPQLWFDAPTPADDWAVFFAATAIDTQANITGSEKIFGCAALSTNATLGSNTLIVTVEHADQTDMFADGDTIRVTDATDPLDSGTGNEEFHVINGTPSVSSLEVTITTTDVLTFGYLVSVDARVMTVYEPATIAATLDTWSETCAGTGTFDEATYPVTTDNIGTIEEDWTITFTDASNFTVEGDTIGFLASGNVTTDYSPSNTDFTKPYFTLLFAGFAGVWAQDDTITFSTRHAATSIWEKRVVPAGAVSLSENSIVLVVAGESA